MSSSRCQYQNSQHSRVMNLKYKSKYKKLQRQIKQLVFVSMYYCCKNVNSTQSYRRVEIEIALGNIVLGTTIHDIVIT